MKSVIITLLKNMRLKNKFIILIKINGISEAYPGFRIE